MKKTTRWQIYFIVYLLRGWRVNTDTSKCCFGFYFLRLNNWTKYNIKIWLTITSIKSMHFFMSTILLSLESLQVFFYALILTICPINSSMKLYRWVLRDSITVDGLSYVTAAHGCCNTPTWRTEKHMQMRPYQTQKRTTIATWPSEGRLNYVNSTKTIFKQSDQNNWENSLLVKSYITRNCEKEFKVK